MYHNAANSLEKLSVEAQIYTMNYLEKEAEVETLGEFTFNCFIFSEAHGCPCTDDREEWGCCGGYAKGSTSSSEY